MAILQLRLLGPPEILAGEKRITIQRRQPRSLLYYLAERAQPVSRDFLLHVLWNEGKASPETLKNRLNVVIRRLKSALPEGALLVRRTSLALKYDQVEVDLWHFQEQSTQIHNALRYHAPNKPLAETLVNRIEQTLGLWHGRTFLEGETLPKSIELSDWLHLTDDQLQRERLALMQRLVAHYRLTGQFDVAMRWVRDWLELDPLDVNAHAEWIQLCHLANRPEAVEEQLAILTRREPSDAQFVLDRLQEQFPNLITKPYRELRPLDGEHAASQPQTPLVGKEMALAQLNTALREGKGVLVVASHGMGKSTLLEWFIRRLPEERWVIKHTCKSEERHRPFATLAALLRKTVSDEQWAALDEVWRARLSTVLPELAERFPPSRPPLSLPPDQQREQVTLALEALFSPLSRKQPLLICLDDAHWIDKDSLLVLASLLVKFRRRIPIVLAVDMAYRSLLEPILTNSLQPPLWREVPLTSLSVEEVHQIMTNLLGTAVSDAFASFFYRKSGGNPQLLEALLQTYLQQHPDSSFDIPPKDLPYPEDLEEGCRERLEVLTELQRRILQVLALFENEVSDDVLAQLLEADPRTIAQEIETLEAIGWLQSEESGRWSLPHDLLRQTVINQMLLAEQQRLHARIARLLNDQPHLVSDPLELAEHLQKAGAHLQAFERYLALAQQWFLEGQPDDAATALKHAENLVYRFPVDFSDALIYRLYELWDHVFSVLDQPEAMEETYQRLRSLGQQRMSSLLLGMAAYGLADACLLRNHFEEGKNYINTALAHLQRAEHPLRWLWARVLQAVFLYMQGDVEQAAHVFDEVAGELERMESSEEVSSLLGHVQYQQSLMATMRGYPKEGKALGLRALQACQAGQNAFGLLLALNNLATSCLFLGDYVEARRYSERAIELAERVHSLRFLGYSQVYRAWIALIQGEVEPAVAWAYRAIGVGEMRAHDEIKALGNRVVGEVYFWLEEPTLALEWYRKAQAQARNTFLEADLMLRIGVAQLRNKQASQAWHLFQKALEAAQTQGQGYVVITAHLAMADLLRQSGEWDRAAARAKDVARAACERGLQAEALQADAIRAQALWQLGQQEAAFDLLESVLHEAERIGHFWLALSTMRTWCHWATIQGKAAGEMKQRVMMELARLHKGLAAYVDKKAVTTGLENTVSKFVLRVRQEIL